ncbi:MAG TPA: isoaspartyl peptidase/L-asparaginase [Candidatus Binatia bacterium]|nr:isoaspartyl peptidase/L-asparaginase [Candidatus Binatia bacterium]
MPNDIRFALHGGAGSPSPEMDVAEQRAALRRIADEALALLRDGGSALDAVERAVVRLEECPLFNAGVGAVLNSDGAPELDAAIMDGRSRACGAIAGVCRVESPVRLARAVMEKSPHVMFLGAGAEAFARELGMKEVSPDHFVTELRFRQLKAAHAKGAILLDHDGGGTVGAVARDAHGHLAAATSTGGLTNKRPGRVGDTPVIGAGTFADDETCAVSCTGSGESFIRAVAGHHVHARLQFSRWTLPQACEEALMLVKRYGGDGGCIAVDREGTLALPFNSRAMFRAWAGADGVVHVAVGRDEA